MGPARFLNGLNITGDLTVTGNILPGANNTYNIGSTSAAWKIGYFKKMSINGGDLSSSTSYTLDVGGTSNFDGNANFSANITVAGTSNLQGDTVVGTTSGNGLNKTLTVNGKVVVNPSYNTANNLYNEGIRINQASNGWAEVAFGGDAGTTSGVSNNIWLVGTYSKNFYISYNGNHTAGNRFQGTPNGFRIYSNTASGAVQTGTLTLGSTDSAYNGSGSGGDVALEFWRGKNASWQIINTGGTLKFRNNYTSAAHATYDVNALDLGYGGNDSVIYTNFKPYVATNATQSTLSLGIATANWDSIYTKTLNFGYDTSDQYLTHSGVATLGTNHSGKITLYRLLASGTSGTRASGSKLRPAVVLDAATGLISLEAGSTPPSSTAGGRIEFKYYNTDSDLGQPVYLSHSVNDSYRPPYGLKVWSTANSNPYTWFEVEGSLYIGTHASATSGTDVDKKRLATSIYIGTKSNGTWNISNVALSGYDTWLRLNDLIDFTSGTYSPFEIRSKTALSVAADTLVSNTNKHDATFYTGVDNATTGTTVTYINTSKNIILNRTSIGTEDATTDDNLFYVDNWSKFKGDLRPDATNTYNLGTSTRRWKTLFIGDADTYGAAGQPIYWNEGVPKAIDWHVGNSSTGEHNCNNVTYNFSGYYTSNGPTAAANGAETSDASLWAQAYSTSWVTQMAQDYRTGQPWVRSKNNGTWTAWKKVIVADESSTTLTDCNNVKFTGIWTHTGFANRPLGVSNWGSLFNIRLYNSNNNFHRQLFFDCYNTNRIWTRANSSGTWTAWQELVRNTGTWDISITGNADTATDAVTASKDSSGNIITNTYVKKAGDTMTGALNTANGTANKIGDDSQLGDFNVGGTLGIQGLNGTTGIALLAQGTSWSSSGNYAKIAYDGTTVSINKNVTISEVLNANRNIFPNATGVPENGETILTALGYKTGYPVYTDPLFESGTNSVNLYNNSNSTAPYTSVTRMTYTDAGINSPGTGSNYVIRIQNTGSGTSPGLGGFYQNISSRANAVFVQIFRALIPVGYTLYTASNSMGASYSDVWLTDPKGTGKWEWYARRVLCGKDGTFSGGGHVYLNGTAGTTSAPVTWYLSYCNLYDLTKAQYDGLRTRYADNADNATNIYSSASTAKAYVLGTTTASSANHATVYNASVYTQGSVLFGAAWNDYAEYRISTIKESGRCIKEIGDDTLELATDRLQPGCEIISDTFGFAIGETEIAKTPIASNGRVLAYPYEDREEFKKHIGEPVCSGPNGTVSIMTEEEWQKYPHCIIGTISAVPDYEEWGTENIKVNGRIWIRIR